MHMTCQQPLQRGPGLQIRAWPSLRTVHLGVAPVKTPCSAMGARRNLQSKLQGPIETGSETRRALLLPYKGLVMESTDQGCPDVGSALRRASCCDACASGAICSHVCMSPLGIIHSITACFQSAACDKAPFDEKSLRVWAPTSRSTELQVRSRAPPSRQSAPTTAAARRGSAVSSAESVALPASLLVDTAHCGRMLSHPYLSHCHNCDLHVAGHQPPTILGLAGNTSYGLFCAMPNLPGSTVVTLIGSSSISQRWTLTA